MFQSENRKKTILFSVTIILLCLISVAGTTLALFTSSGNGGTIGINATSGNLGVDLVDAQGSSLVGRTLGFMTTSSQKTLYWEPGAAFCTQGFKVENTGDIPMNFRMYINTGEEDNELKNALEFYITQNPFDLSNAQKLDEYRGTLQPGQCSETFYLVVHMKESAGNEYLGTSLSGVGIMVYAIQANAQLN